MADAAIGIAVFLDDHQTFDHALKRFRERVPAYFYLEKDGKVPLSPVGSTIDTEETRPAGTDDLFVSWETLTHAGNPAT